MGTWTPAKRQYRKIEQWVNLASEKCYRDQIRKREIWGIKAGFHGKM
jgi:hypothetical protein